MASKKNIKKLKTMPIKQILAPTLMQKKMRYTKDSVKNEKVKGWNKSVSKSNKRLLKYSNTGK